MTQEEKVKRYDEALERAKKLQETCDSTAVVGWCEYIFPELKESEDERIKREILELVSIAGNGNQFEEIKDWLEKQGHMLNSDKVVEWLECKAFQGWAEPIDIRPIIRKFKKDFGL